MRELSIKIGSGSTPRGGRSVYQNKGIKFIRSQNVYDDGLYLDDVVYISDEINKQMNGSIIQPNDILLNITGASLGRCAIVPHDFDIGNVNQHVSIIRLVDSTFQAYTHKVVISNYLQGIIKNVQVGAAQEGLPAEKQKELFIPLPPLAEQSRIVAAIDTTFAIIGKIERNQTDLQATITAAKSKILSLAIRGRLVPQDPNDEPASGLLERIRAEREKNAKAGKIKRTRGESTIFRSVDNSYYGNLPNGWAWCRLDEVLEYEQPTQYIVESTGYNDDYVTPVLTAGKTFIIGYTNEKNGICDNLPVIIFDDFTTDSKYVDFAFKVKSSAMKILRSKHALIKYLYLYMQTIECNHSTHKRYWISDFSQKFMALPPIKEQQRIVMAIEILFKQLDKISENIC